MDNLELAIGLSGAVFKLVLLSIDFVGNAKQVYKLGATDRSIDLSTITKSIAVTTTNLEAQLRITEENRLSDGQSLDVEEEQLKELSQRAAKIGRELEKKLTRVTVDKGSKWKSFKAAVVGTWNADEIKAIEQRLISIKDEMQLRILVDIRNKIEQSHNEDKSRLVSTLEEVTNQRAVLREDGRHMAEMLNNADGVSQQRHNKLVQIGNQLLKGIDALSIPGPPNLPVLTTLRKDTRQSAEKIILNSLWYPSIRDREETISKAHAKTFQWVFEDPKTAGKPWDSFANFLRGDQPIFWMTGKPGCGKSTLMKFINRSPKTRVLLRDWARERELILISYYFYYNGSEYQKSEVGLIRSLLYSILNQKHELIPIAFGDRYQAVTEGKILDDLSLPEARKALRDLILHSPNLCFFLSIDGLDEFDPAVSLSRVQSLIELTRSFTKTGNVKVLVSSRPLPEFEHGYGDYASLRVHELTQEDICQYANEKLMNHPRMEIIFQNDSKGASYLLQSIVESSLGVFLWVRLVTESLIEGLTNYDTIGDLKKRLDELPPDLEELYRVILRRVDPLYKSQSARLLSFVYHICGRRDELALLDLWFAENADDEMVYKTQVKPLEDEEVREREREIATRLKSRCRGLVEIEHSQTPWGPYDSTRSMIYDRSNRECGAIARFIHRSVYEFLSHPATWNEFVVKAVDPAFSVTLSLFRSSILIIKTCRRASSKNVMLLASYAGVRAHSAEKEREQSHSNLVYELDTAMHEIIARHPIPRDLQNISSLSHPEYHWSDWCRSIVNPEWMQLEIRPDKHDRPAHKVPTTCAHIHGSLLAFAAEYGLQYFIRYELSKRGRGILKEHEFPLLGYALTPPGGWKKPDHLDVGGVRLLLDEGCSLNKLYKGIALWEWFFFSLPPFTSKYSSDIILSLQRIVLTIEMLLVAGANPNGRVLWEKLQRPRVYGSSRSLCTLLTALTKIHKDHLKIKTHSPSKYTNCVEQVDETILRVIKILKKRGAMTKVWGSEESFQHITEFYQRVNANEAGLEKALIKLVESRKYSLRRHTQKGWREILRNKVLTGTRFLGSGSIQSS
ncbi:hypothetical protein GGR51DRAFT_70517 [Nemania sp. FL0031]|nr:hypothetical protein GGR51DRAFT_70517 [Nemania sp. FL0031]